MKFFYKVIYPALFIALSVLAQSCEEPTQVEEVGSHTSVELSASSEQNFSATSALYTIESQGYESYAYHVTEGEPLEPTEPVVIYNDAEEIFPITQKNIESAIYGLEGNTKYTIEFAFKEVGKNVYATKSLEFTTADYDQIISIVECGYYNVKFAINVPDDAYYRYLIMPRLDKLSLQAQFGTPDSEFLSYGAIGHGSQVVDFKDGDLSFLKYGDEDVTAVVKPGSSFVVLVAECDAEGKLLDPMTVQMPVESRSNSQPIFDGYAQSEEDAEAFSAVAYTCSKLPAEAEGEVNVDIRTTESSAYINITPSEEIYAYTALLLHPADLERFYEWAGESGVGTEMQKMTEPVAGEIEFQYTGLELGVEYKLAIVYSSDEMSLTRSLEFFDVQTVESQLPPIELEITDAVSEDPYSVSFNIKCPTKDCGVFYYLMNSSQAFSSLLAQGYSYEYLAKLYGIEEGNEEILEGINSDEGYTMTFDSWESTESTLAIMTYNVDEKPHCSVGYAVSPKEPARPAVESPLFTSLLGDWTTTYTFKPGWTLNDTASATMTKSFKTTITDDPDFGPESFDSSHPDYQTLFDYWVEYAEGKEIAEPEVFAKEQIASSFKEYKETAEKFKAKYKEQNRLLMVGFTPYVEYNTINSWDLFCDMGYSAYNTDQIFFDFGPKMFLQIKDDESMALEVNPKYIAPARSYDMTYYVGAVSCTSFQGLFEDDIPVVADTEDKMRISAMSHTFDDGSVLDNFFLSYYYYDAVGTPYPSTVGFAEPEMTRGYTEPADASYQAVSSSLAKAAMPAALSREQSGRFKRPYMPTFKVERKSVETRAVDGSQSVLKSYVSKLAL